MELSSRSVSNRRNPSSRAPERGGGRLKAIIWTLIFVAFVYTLAKVTPILINEYQFEDGITTIARFATVYRQSPEQIRQAVVKEAQKDDVDIRPEDIQVEANGGNVRINADYSVIVDLHVYQWTMNFHPAARNNAL